jgi:glycosyltransferase involved in cell wall biosynthesis
MKPKVTIGVCARNSEKTIQQAIDSAAAQDYDHKLMEMIFVDDGSTDLTLKMMQASISKVDFHVQIFTGEWRGIAKGRNTVVENAKGDYIIWLDSDEVLVKDFVRKQVQLMDLNPQAAIATGRMGIQPDMSLMLQLDLLPYISEYLTKDWRDPSKLPGTGATTFRLSAIKGVGGFNSTLSGACEDIEVAYRMTQAGWSVVRGDSCFYETHENMITIKELWKRSVRRGIHSRELHCKSPLFFSFYTMNPVASFVAGIRYSFLSFLVTKKKISFLLTFYFPFKMTAWYYGFTKR